jgi:hypothetical protein
VDDQLIDQHLGGGAHIVLGRHGNCLGIGARNGGMKERASWARTRYIGIRAR